MTIPTKGRGTAERAGVEHPSGTESLRVSGGKRATTTSRRTYQRPSVQKQRSVYEATLVSSGGTSGTLTSGAP